MKTYLNCSLILRYKTNILINIVFTLTIFFNTLFYSQTAANYTFTSSTGVTLDAMSGSTQLIGSGFDDAASNVTNIGFDFLYEDITYTQFSVSSNGLLKLGSVGVTTEYTNTVTSTTNKPKIFGVWDDLSTASNGKVHYKLSGTAPNRILIVEYKLRNAGASGISQLTNMTHQVWLYETTNVIQFLYGTGTLTVNSASIGIGGLTATNYLTRNHLTNNTCSNTGGLNTISTWPSSMTYTYNPRLMTISSSLSTFSGCTGIASASQNFSINGSNLSSNIVITAPTGFEISISAASGYASSLTLVPVSGVVNSTTIYVRLASSAIGSPAGNITCVSSPATTVNVSATGTVSSISATPVISGVYCSGQTTVSGTGVSGASISIIRSGISIGTATVSGTSWSSTVSVLSASDVLTATQTETSKCISSASSSTTVTSCSTPTISSTGTLSAFTTCAGNSSSIQSFTLSGTVMTTGISVNPPVGFEVSTSSTFASGNGYNGSPILVGSSGTISSTTIYVRLQSSSTGTPSGNIVCSSTGATSVNVAVSGTVTPIITNNSSGAAVDICSGLTTVLTGGTVAGGTSSYTYLWESSSNNSAWSTATGASNAANYTTAALSTSTYFRRNVTSGACTVVATSILVTVIALPTISSQPSNSSILQGNSTTFSVATSSSSPTYQWQYSSNNSSWSSVVNATPVGSSYTNATSSVLSVATSLSIAPSTYYYRCVVTSTSGGCFTNSNGANLVVTVVNDACANATNLPCGTSSLSGTTIGTVSETAPTGSSSPYGVWYNFIGDGVSTTISSLSGSGFDHELTIFSAVSCGSTYTLVASLDNAGFAATETYTFTPVSGTNYYVYIAHWSTSSTTTGTFTISRTCSSPAIVVSVSNSSICSGSSSTISAASSASYTYTWSPSTGLNVSTGAVVVASPLVTTTYTVTGTLGSTSTTNSTTIIVISAVSGVTANSSSNSICIGNSLNLTSISTVSGTASIFNQNFATSTLPTGVTTVIGSGDAIAITNTSNAGGSAYEVTITGNSQTNNIIDRLVTGPINTSGQTSLTLEWRNYLNHYSNSWVYGVSVQTSTDNITWHNTSWLTATVTSSMPSSLQSLVLNSSDIGSSTLYISFTATGKTFGFHNWYIDDISLLGVGTNNYSWSSVPVGFTSSLQNPTNISPSTSTVYTVSVMNLNGCSSTASTSVTVNLPSVPTSTVVGVGDLVWAGGVSTNYSLSSNWINFNGSNYVANTVSPSNLTNIVIPPVGTCVVNQPVISSTTVNAKDVLISNGGSLTLGAGGYLIVKGNWTNNSTTAALNLDATSIVKFNGSTLQTINELFPSVFSNLTIDNSSNVKILSDLTVLNTLTLTSGKFIVDFGKTLYIGTNVSPVSNGTITGASGSSYIVAYDNGVGIGSVKRVINSAGSTLYEFPIGDLTNYTPLSYTLVSGTLSNATLTVYTKPSKIFGLNVQLSNYLNRYWEVLPSGITNSVYNVSFNYTNADIVGTETSLIPIKKSGSTWYKPTGTSFLTGTDQGTYAFDAGTNRLSWNGLSTYSKFGGVGNQAVNLPIELLDFVGENLNKSNVLNWTTFSELDNDFFTIEYSIDGYNFENIGLVNGAGNSSESNNYEFIHSDYRKEINYYRLQQTDFNGMNNNSELISIDNREKIKEILMTTNLIGQEVNENYKGLVVVVYTDGTILRKIQ